MPQREGLRIRVRARVRAGVRVRVTDGVRVRVRMRERDGVRVKVRVRVRVRVRVTHVVRRRISLVGSYGARASVDMPDLLEIAAKGGVDLRGAITRRFTLEEAGEAYTLLQQRKIVGRAIVTFL